MIQEKVVTTIALVLEQFLLTIKKEVPQAKFVYDESLSYETAIEKFRADNNITPSERTDALPLFAFKRSVLKYSEHGLSRRSSRLDMSHEYNTAIPNTSNVFKTVHGELDIEFLFIIKSAQDAELFEIEYLSELGITRQKELIVNTQEDLGLNLQYFVWHNPLADKSIQTDINYFKAIQGSVRIRGFYPVFKTRSKHILDVTGNIYQTTNELIKTSDTRLSNIHITA